MPTQRKKLLGQMLLEKNLISQKQLEEALAKQKEMGELLGTVLVEMGYIDHEMDLLPVIAEQYSVNYVYLKSLLLRNDVIERIPYRFAHDHHVLALDFFDNVLTVAMSKPYDIMLCDEIKLLTNMEIKPVLAGRYDIDEAIKKYYGIGADTIEKIMGSEDSSHEQTSLIEDIDEIFSEATIGNFLNQIFLEAYHRRATDIHIEPFENHMAIRYRIDGLLYDIHVPDNIGHFKDSLCSRIKIMANLDISEKRLPQDGRLRVRVDNNYLDLRISFLPTPHGESAVIRILNSTKLYSFDELDLSENDKAIMDDLIQKSHGIIFITGPTGSGKTTTLYSALSKINTVEKKIITLEDPVEYQLKGITQIQINSGIQFTFSRGLRSILRHDPDVIMVGEVRDVETAEIAIQVALTGHLIFSTLHTNDAASGITRLLNMGVEPYLITSTVECFIAQRLVRVLCPKCKSPRELSPAYLEKLGIPITPFENVTFYEPKGCSRCNFSGYVGRTGIFEFLIINEEIAELILNRATASQIKQKAMEYGMTTLRQSGWEKAKRGMTTPEEVLRVTQDRSKRK